MRTLVYSFSAGPVFASYNQFNATLQLARQGDVTAQRELGERERNCGRSKHKQSG